MVSDFASLMSEHARNISAAKTFVELSKAVDKALPAMEGALSMVSSESRTDALPLMAMLRVVDAVLKQKIVQDETLATLTTRVATLENDKSKNEKRLAKLERILNEKMSDNID